MFDEFTVVIVDDDSSVRDALTLLLGVHGYRVAVFSDAESFLKAYNRSWRGCVLIDIRMPGMDGLTLQKKLIDLGAGLPVIIMTGHGDVASARDAFRSLAIDFLEKPLDMKKLLAAIADAISLQCVKADIEQTRNDVQRLLGTLTPREKEVMEKVVAGQHNRDIAKELGISPRTVEVHKARMMDKLSVTSVADLVRFSLR
jgi:RNA polymerase sigma factor (sigma-70 family)